MISVSFLVAVNVAAKRHLTPSADDLSGHRDVVCKNSELLSSCKHLPCSSSRNSPLNSHTQVWELVSVVSSKAACQLGNISSAVVGCAQVERIGAHPQAGTKSSEAQAQSIDQGPFELGTTRDALGTTPEGGVLLGPERPRTYEDLSDTEKKRYDADVRATNIVLQGLPNDIYKLINHNIEAKSIWDNVKILLAGSELTKEYRESQLYDEFERFKMLPGELANEYYVRFHKLVNDMRNIIMTMPNIQLNSKFVNNMSPEWDRFVTAVKLKKGLKGTNHEQLYAYLKLHEKHAAQDRLIIERITPATNDQLAFVSTVQPHAQSSHVQSHQYPSSSTNSQSLQYPQFTETSQIDSRYTQTDEILNNLTKQMALLAQSFRATLPQTNNQL
ncbi:hypothetical protein Tco_0039272 [Tanacetum coccineum]